MGLSAGLLDREIVLQTATKSQDADTGEEILTFTDQTLWAQWLPAGTTETWRAQQRIGSYIDGVYRIYFREDVYPDVSRIIGHDGRTYDVKPPSETVQFGRRSGLDVPVVAHGEAA